MPRNCVLRYLEETAKKMPNKVAIVDDSGELTFCQLRQRARILAKKIAKETGGARGKPIFVYLPKSAASVVSFMAILYSGNFYTPTDVRFPLEKPRSILSKLRPTACITDSAHFEVMKNLQAGGVINLDEINFSELESEELDEEECEILQSVIDTDIAYTLFTSGSTGTPKGVCIMHRGIIDYIDWVKEHYKITELDSILNQAPFYFDNSTFDIYLCISTGATLHITPESFYSFPPKLLSYIAEHKITTLFWVPSIIIYIANSEILSNKKCPDLSSLKRVIFAGEVMPNKALNVWRKALPNVLFANLYGPTEITVDCTFFDVTRDFRDDEPLPIGKPYKNSDVFLLSENNTLVTKAGEQGEICVRGAGLAAGYWCDIEKTNEVFVQNPLNKSFFDRIYKTGDIAHYNEYGELMYDGRRDFQIKHMGYRIELGEIETAASGLGGVGEACCVYDAAKKEIRLFFVGDTDEKQLRKGLSSVLPRYMIPTKYTKLDSFPHNANGKIDRGALCKMGD